MQVTRSAQRPLAQVGANAARRSAPASPSLHRLAAGLGACQARRGGALTLARQTRAPSSRVAVPVVYAAASAELEDVPEAVCHLRYDRGSPYKVRRVLDQIRGRSYEQALLLLEFMPYRSCERILKVLVSAGANAKTNLNMRKKNLYVAECYANEGPRLKRFQPRAKGRPYQIIKPMVHVTIKLRERAED